MLKFFKDPYLIRMLIFEQACILSQLELPEILSLTKMERDYLYQAFVNDNDHNLKEAVAALKTFQQASKTLRIS